MWSPLLIIYTVRVCVYRHVYNLKQFFSPVKDLLLPCQLLSPAGALGLNSQCAQPVNWIIYFCCDWSPSLTHSNELTSVKGQYWHPRKHFDRHKAVWWACSKLVSYTRRTNVRRLAELILTNLENGSCPPKNMMLKAVWNWQVKVICITQCQKEYNPISFKEINQNWKYINTSMYLFQLYCTTCLPAVHVVSHSFNGHCFAPMFASCACECMYCVCLPKWQSDVTVVSWAQETRNYVCTRNAGFYLFK